MIKAPPTPKGFRDISPDLAQKRRQAINTMVSVLENYGFGPIETPTIEFAQTLLGKYGEEERLIYEFTDRGGRQVALRYDLTVPLARYVATYNPQLPFRRYQIGQVFRGESPQHGRYREFTQLDFDTVGSADLAEDAKIIAATLEAAKALGIKKAVMAINDRKNFKSLPVDVTRAFDKIHKIGRPGVEKELQQKGHPKNAIDKFFETILNAKPTENLERLFEILQSKYKLMLNHDFFFDESLARGLDYYTGSIFELKIERDLKAQSLGGGGRYDNLIGMFSKQQIPAVGFSFGVDRLVEAIP